MELALVNIGMVTIKRATQKHCKQIAKIEAASFPIPWSTSELTAMINEANVLAFVAEIEEEVVGYIYISKDGPDCFEVVNLAVKEEHRRKGIASQMIEQLKKAVSSKTMRCLLQAIVVDFNLPAQMFFKKLGFRATHILKGHYESDNDNEAYLFEFIHFKGKARFKI